LTDIMQIELPGMPLPFSGSWQKGACSTARPIVRVASDDGLPELLMDSTAKYPGRDRYKVPLTLSDRA
jgi:hypothetical protein